MRLHRIKKEVKDLKPITIGSETLNVGYYPNEFTPELEEANNRAQSDPTAGGVLKRMLVPLLAHWDLTDEYPVMVEADGKTVPATDPASGEAIVEERPVPITEEGLHNVPLKVLGMVLELIAEDLNPGKEQSTSSAAPSSWAQG